MAIIFSDKVKAKMADSPDKVVVLDIVSVDTCCSAILDVNPYWAKATLIRGNPQMVCVDEGGAEYFYHKSLEKYIAENDFVVETGLLGGLKFIDRDKKLMKSLYIQIEPLKK